MGLKRTNNDYKETHIGTYRYRCKKSPKDTFWIHKQGNYEPLASFKALPTYKEFKKNGRKWTYTKTYQPVMDRIILDVDCEDLGTALQVTKQLMQDFNEYTDCINIYFSGSKGFHIEILTEELDIIDITVKQPKDSCYQYAEFLNYFNDKYPEVDTSLKDVGSRVIRMHHTKHEKTGNYKILVDVNASLEDILTSSKANKDMVEPKTAILDKDKALLLLNTFNKPIADKPKKDQIKFEDLEWEADDSKTDDSIYSIVFNELKCDRHQRIGKLGSGLNGYVDQAELERIYSILANTTDIEESSNAEQSFYDAYNSDKMPCNLGALRNEYEKENLDLTNFNKLSAYLNSKLEKNHYDKFNNLLESYNYDWIEMLETELFDYVDNTKNVFNAVIHSLSALVGYKKASRIIVVNGGAGVGKSEFVNTIEKLMPKFIDLGSSTPATVRRRNEYYFNNKIVYLGDKGLRGQTEESKKEFQGLYEVFGGLVSDHKYKRDVMEGNEIGDYNLKSNGICVIYTEPYTNLHLFGAGEQYTDRSTFITINPVKDGLALFLQDEEKINPFYNIHKNYIRHILKNPIEITLDTDVKTALYQASKDNQRTAKYLRDLFKGYCQYLQIGHPLTTDVIKFLEVFKPHSEVTDIEYLIYTKLYNNLNVVTADDLEYLISEDGTVDFGDILLQTKDRKDKTFFTAKQIKTYFKQDFKRNKNLKDTIDRIPDILNNLYNAEYIDKLDWQYNNQNVYYIPKNDEMEN